MYYTMQSEEIGGLLASLSRKEQERNRDWKHFIASSDCYKGGICFHNPERKRKNYPLSTGYLFLSNSPLYDISFKKIQVMTAASSIKKKCPLQLLQLRGRDRWTRTAPMPLNYIVFPSRFHQDLLAQTNQNKYRNVYQLKVSWKTFGHTGRVKATWNIPAMIFSSISF